MAIDVKDILKYVDSMMIIDKNYKVIYTNRFSPRFGSRFGFNENEYMEYNNKRYFDVYPDLEPNQSTMVQVLQYGKTVIREGQSFSDMRGRVYATNNITFPIIRFGEVVGAIELSQDITSVGDLEYTDKNSLKSITNHPNKITNEDMSFDSIITNNPGMREQIRKAKIFALDENPTLIYGETGTGKEMFVEAMVNSNKARKDKYVAQNCAAIPETLFDSILFGSVKGAFTGAENRSGLFEQADGGILFLDELNSMPMHLQAKLLRVLQDGKVRPVGSTVEKKINVKVIIAMNKNPMQLIKGNQLREDLFYRLSSSMFYLTPLRERPEDIPLYIDYFLSQFNGKYNKQGKKLSNNLKKMLQKYHWPGNVRELRHVIESMICVSQEAMLTTKNLPAYLLEVIDMGEDGMDRLMGLETAINLKVSLKKTLEKVEREHILKALVVSNGNVSRAAEILDIPRQTLKFRIDKLGIENFKTKE
jgi:arginine utilization regulatory protein